MAEENEDIILNYKVRNPNVDEENEEELENEIKWIWKSIYKILRNGVIKLHGKLIDTDAVSNDNIVDETITGNKLHIVGNDEQGIAGKNINNGTITSDKLIDVRVAGNGTKGINAYNINDGTITGDKLIDVRVAGNGTKGINAYNINDGTIIGSKIINVDTADAGNKGQGITYQNIVKGSITGDRLYKNTYNNEGEPVPQQGISSDNINDRAITLQKFDLGLLPTIQEEEQIQVSIGLKNNGETIYLTTKPCLLSFNDFFNKNKN